MVKIRHVAHLGINHRGQLHYREWAGNLSSKTGRVILSNREILSKGSTFTDYDNKVHQIQAGDTLQFEDGLWKLIHRKQHDSEGDLPV